MLLENVRNNFDVLAFVATTLIKKLLSYLYNTFTNNQHFILFSVNIFFI